MQISKRTLILSGIGAIFLCSCALVFLFSLQSLSGSAPPEEGEASGAEPTAPPASELPTSIPVLTAQPSDPAQGRPALPERRRVTLEFPPRMRAGDSEIVRLTLEVDDLGNITPTAEIEGNVIIGETIEIPNLYDTHHVIAEARFDLAGMQVAPPDLAGQTLTQGQSVTFYWSIRPDEPGFYRGTIWLYLRFVDRENGEESRKAVSAQLVEIEAVNLLGLSGSLARMTGIVGSVIGTVIGFPFFEDILRFLLRRWKKPSSS